MLVTFVTVEGRQYTLNQCIVLTRLSFVYISNKHLYKFTELSVSHKIDLFDKLITPIINYASEVWDFDHGKVIERVHLQF